MMVETEAVLLTRFTKTGDAQAFAEIIRRHAGLVYGAALRILADVDRASDVAQETFLQLTKDAHSVTGSLPGWLHRVATHKAIDQMRRDTSRRRREVEYAAERPREVAEWRDLSRHVDEELSKLDSETRDILVAHFLQGRTTREIAVAQGVSQATVSRRVDAGVTQLRATLRKRGILVAAATLSLLLGKNAVQAAPQTLMTELGKMALVGGHAAAGAAGASTINTIAGGVLAGVKAKAVAVAAVAVIGAGSVVTYQHATRAPSPSHTVVTNSPTPRTPRSSSGSVAVSTGAPVSKTGPSEASRRWNELLSARGSQTARSENLTPVPQPPVPQEETAAVPEGEAQAAPEAGFGGMGYAMAMAGPAEPSPDEGIDPNAAPPMGGMYFSVAQVESPPTDPNDSNDSGPNDL
jgi:RNA polymerase sigma factor (sigma-70 family)